MKVTLREVKYKPCAIGGGPTIPQKEVDNLTALEEKIKSLNPIAFDGVRFCVLTVIVLKTIIFWLLYYTMYILYYYL